MRLSVKKAFLPCISASLVIGSITVTVDELSRGCCNVMHYIKFT